MTSSKFEVAICGCGPAGLSAALLLQRAGHRVRIFERFEHPRPVGSGLILQPTGLAVLAELGLLAEIAALGARIERLFGRVVPSNRVVLDVRYSALGAGWCALAVHRSALFDLLHRAVVASGIEIEPGVTISRIERGRARVAVIATERRCGDFDLVVDALGANSPLAAGLARRTVLPYGALWANVPWHQLAAVRPTALEQRYRHASQMAGVLPIGRCSAGDSRQAAFFWSLKCDQVEAWRSGGLAAWKAEVSQLWPEIAPMLGVITDVDQLTFARYQHFTVRAPYSERLVHIGDAARATSPQLGQGANMALLDALALTRSLDASRSLQEGLQAYARMRNGHMRLFQWASATFTPFYQSDSLLLPLVRDWLAAPLSRLPMADAVLARLVAGMSVTPLAGAQFTPMRLGLPSANDRI